MPAMSSVERTADKVAGSCATGEFVTVAPGERLQAAAELMRRHDVSHLMVVDPAGVRRRRQDVAVGDDAPRPGAADPGDDHGVYVVGDHDARHRKVCCNDSLMVPLGLMVSPCSGFETTVRAGGAGAIGA